MNCKFPDLSLVRRERGPGGFLLGFSEGFLKFRGYRPGNPEKYVLLTKRGELP
jgi:hypothetical protein